MSKYQIAVIVGSLRPNSLNLKRASAVAKLAPPEYSFKQVQIGDLPLYNQDDDANQAESVKRLKCEITAAQGVKLLRPNTTALSRRSQERHRPRLAPLWPKRLGGASRWCGGRFAQPTGHGYGTTEFCVTSL
jgi:hypothetical protein